MEIFLNITKYSYHLISCNIGKLDEVKDQLKQIEDIREFEGTFGPYDIIVKTESQPHLQKVIEQQIRTLIGVRSALTLKCKPPFHSISC